ncbi:MAG: hypothetical protein RR842_04035 [Gordonibacter sp.]|uniref:hypothetical protein n=1 Tax=Gordonibacter sp. TaxID=1968902 RepID=UPI002FCB0854
MVFFELRKRNGDIATYDYMPENEKANRGIISLNLTTGSREVIEKSSDDKGFDYAAHALRAIGENFSASGSLQKKGWVAWY